MKTFKEYLLDEMSINEQTIYMPYGASVVNVKQSYKGLMLLAIVTPDEYAIELPEIRTFKICTNDEIFYAGTVKYIGSFESLIGTKHVIEILRSFK